MSFNLAPALIISASMTPVRSWANSENMRGSSGTPSSSAIATRVPIALYFRAMAVSRSSSPVST